MCDDGKGEDGVCGMEVTKARVRLSERAHASENPIYAQRARVSRARRAHASRVGNAPPRFQGHRRIHGASSLTPSCQLIERNNTSRLIAQENLYTLHGPVTRTPEHPISFYNYERRHAHFRRKSVISRGTPERKVTCP